MAQPIIVVHSPIQSSRTPTPQRFVFPEPSRLSTLTTLYLLRFNVSLHIAIFAIVVNLLLAVFTFLLGSNALYCAFGMDCVIGILTSAILVWRFATNKRDQFQESMHEQSSLMQRKKRGSVLCLGHSPRALGSLPSPLKSPRDWLEASMESVTSDDNRREMWSTFLLGCVMIFSALVIIARTCVELITLEHHENPLDAILGTQNKTLQSLPDKFATVSFNCSIHCLFIVSLQMQPLLLLSYISFGVNLALMVVKIAIYHFLGFNSMLIEGKSNECHLKCLTQPPRCFAGVNSLISSIFALMAIISISYSEYVQCLDQVVSFLFGSFLFFYGLFNVITTAEWTIVRWIKRTALSRHYRHAHLQRHKNLKCQYVSLP